MPLRIARDPEPTLNLIPMIDVMLQLLIFFMLGTKFADMMERKIKIEVPRVVDAGALTPAPERRVVNVFRDGGLTLDGTPVSLSGLRTALGDVHRQYAELGVIVRGDAKGQFQRVADALNACKQAGIREIGIAVLPADREQ